MKKGIEVKITRNKITEITCDLCGNITKSDHWEDNIFERNMEAELELSYSASCSDEYGYGGELAFINIDICPNCFRKKLMPFLKGHGLKHEIKYDCF